VRHADQVMNIRRSRPTGSRQLSYARMSPCAADCHRRVRRHLGPRHHDGRQGPTPGLESLTAAMSEVEQNLKPAQDERNKIHKITSKVDINENITTYLRFHPLHLNITPTHLYDFWHISGAFCSKTSVKFIFIRYRYAK